MPFFQSRDDLKIHYETEGNGPDVIMVHGFMADLEYNWRQPGVTAALRDENRVIMIDCRGHGMSDKPHDPAMYGDRMLDDLVDLMNHLGILKANFCGYSMGTWICLKLLLREPERFRSAVLGGFTLKSFDPTALPRRAIAEALEADNLSEVTNPVAQGMRRFAERMGGDFRAWAAFMAAFAAERSSGQIMVEELKACNVPLMTIMANDDFLPGEKTEMAMLVPNGCHFQIQGRDHLTVVADPKFSMIIKTFLSQVNSP